MARRLMLYDDTCRGQDGRLPLTWAWSAGGPLYRGLGRLDAARGITSWAEGLDWLASQQAPIAEVQFWGHGRWGRAMVGSEVLDVSALQPEHPLHPALNEIRAKLTGSDALWWWRTCETYGADAGQRFAERWSTFMGCRSAGHTHIIGLWQSGLRGIRPGQAAWWDAEEGLLAGTPASPQKARSSAPTAPDTISFLTGTIPAGCWR